MCRRLDALDVPQVVCDVLEVAERCTLNETGEPVEAKQASVEERKVC